MIDEKRLIEEIINTPSKVMNEIPYEPTMFTNIQNRQNEILDIIDRQPKVGEWIPCSERLPEADGDYLVTTKYSQIPTILEWRMGYWFDEEANIYKVVAWMPLPAPFKESED